MEKRLTVKNVSHQKTCDIFIVNNTFIYLKSVSSRKQTLTQVIFWNNLSKHVKKTCDKKRLKLKLKPAQI